MRISSLRPLCLCLLALGCGKVDGHGPYAETAVGPMGSAVGYATTEQLATFDRGLEVATRRFMLEDGVGPAFNVTFCGACHEKPVFGGSAGLYRNFFLGASKTPDGAYLPIDSAGAAGGVIRLYDYSVADLDDDGIPDRDYQNDRPVRTEMDPRLNVVAQRNPIPFFGVGPIAALSESVILANADPEDEDGDGISGRPNYDRGFVGRFGVKAQTVSIEGFIRGPLFNHLGVTSDPLTDAEKAKLPVDSSGDSVETALRRLVVALSEFAQAAAPDSPLTDDDGIADPELKPSELFDLVSYSMLLAGPKPEPLTDKSREGLRLFDDIGCASCHVPRLEGPRGALPLYSDLLLHDMGEGLADGIQQGEATGSEFRTQPLWGLAAVAPYLHDGRAHTIEEAVNWHGGEGEKARSSFLSLSGVERGQVVEFLLSLGGRDQYTPGLVALDAPIPAVGAWGGPIAALDSAMSDRYLDGRTLFDTEFGLSDGAGSPRFNGDSCRACHFEPVVGGAGPRGVNVVRHGIINEDGAFVPPVAGTILHRETILSGLANTPQPEANVFELRQTPHLFGLGLIEGIADDEILSRVDAEDADGDGISGRPSWTDGGRLGRFGWKGQIPDIHEFVRDAVTMELGMTLPYEADREFGWIQDNDDVADPEFSQPDTDLLTWWLSQLAPPPRTPALDASAADRGEVLFADVGCGDCHVPALQGAEGPVPLYSDLLLHEILPEGAAGIEEFSANVLEFRTAPLWGIAGTAPYLHDGRADTLDQAVRGHAGEADLVREAYLTLDEAARADLLAFLGTL